MRAVFDDVDRERRAAKSPSTTNMGIPRESAAFVACLS
jgi:hypothetical protein